MGEQWLTKVTMLFLWPSFLYYAKIMKILFNREQTLWDWLNLNNFGIPCSMCQFLLLHKSRLTDSTVLHWFGAKTACFWETEQLCRNSSKPNFALCLWLTPLTFVALIWMSFDPTKVFCKSFCHVLFLTIYIEVNRGFKLSIKAFN